jgi:alkylhydroperoxidase family enzyme
VALIPYVTETDACEPAAALGRIKARRGWTSLAHQVLANSPSALDTFDVFSKHINEDSPLEPAIRELCILRVIQHVGNTYEWNVHIPLALKAGVEPAVLEGLNEWQSSSAVDARQQATLALVDDYLDDWRISDETGARLNAAFIPEEIVELVVTLGWHLLVASFVIPLGLIEDDQRPKPSIAFTAA